VILSAKLQTLAYAAVFAIVWAVAFLQKLLIPHLAQVRLAGAGGSLGFPLSSAYEGISDSENSRAEQPAADGRKEAARGPEGI
jgi:hypothetical protein